MPNYLSLQRLAHFLIIALIVLYGLVIGRDLLVPFAFSIFFAFLLKPICNAFEHWLGGWRMLSISITFLVVALPILGAVTFFTVQFITVINSLAALSELLVDAIDDAFMWLEQNYGVERQSGEVWILEHLSGFINQPLGILGTGLRSSTSFVANAAIVLIYTFLLLLYRSAIKSFFLTQFGHELRPRAQDFLHDVQFVVQRYLYGMALVIVFLGLTLSTGLWIIGIEHAFFWGFLAAFLAIVPYIGTFMGGLFPFLYALINGDTLWQPLAVLLLYVSVQQLEGNFVTPKVVGSSVKINPLAAIAALIAGGALWGIAGLVLALPAVAILRVFFQSVDYFKPLAMLLSSDIYDKSAVFQDEFDHERYRLLNIFRHKRGDA